ncbi:helix-turn-helix domain-containing protein [Methylosinus sp. Sm6]|nr:hypothetical protein [Methylosinus sp. Sm6]
MLEDSCLQGGHLERSERSEELFKGNLRELTGRGRYRAWAVI